MLSLLSRLVRDRERPTGLLRDCVVRNCPCHPAAVAPVLLLARPRPHDERRSAVDRIVALLVVPTTRTAPRPPFAPSRTHRCHHGNVSTTITTVLSPGPRPALCPLFRDGRHRGAHSRDCGSGRIRSTLFALHCFKKQAVRPWSRGKHIDTGELSQTRSNKDGWGQRYNFTRSDVFCTKRRSRNSS